MKLKMAHVGQLFSVLSFVQLFFWWAWYATTHSMAVDYSKPFRQRGETVHDTIYVRDTIRIHDTIQTPMDLKEWELVAHANEEYYHVWSFRNKKQYSEWKQKHGF